VNGEYRLVDMKFVAIPEFSGNEAYGAMPTGLVVWQLGTDGYDTTRPMTETVFRDFTGWHLHESAFFGYPAYNTTFKGWKVRGQRRALGENDGGVGWWTGDYKNRNSTIRHADIQGMSNGIDGSTATEGALLIEDSYFSNFRSNIYMVTLATPGTSADPLPRTTIVRNTVFDPMPGSPQFTTIEMDWTLSRGNTHPQTSDRLFLYDYNGMVGANYQVFYPEQASQNIAGGLASCTATRVEVDGLVCPITGPPAPTLTGVTPTSGDSAGGGSVAISGAQFRAGAQVEFGGLPATNVAVANATRITARAPAHAAGLVSVNVTNNDGLRGRLADAYTFVTPACSISLDSTSAAFPTSGGTGTVSVTATASCKLVRQQQRCLGHHHVR
jgi:hypothetical protein